jgi:uncharacterized membrane-anchored protein
MSLALAVRSSAGSLDHDRQSLLQSAFGKVPEVTFGFWLIKVIATTLGETAGDAVTMSLGLGYFYGTCLFALALAFLVAAQIRTQKFHPFLFWGVIVATTTMGTTLADFADRSLGIGYVGGVLSLGLALAGSIFLWYRVCGSVSLGSITSPKQEIFYWVTILLSQTLGTAAGDFIASNGAGYGGGAIFFGVALVVTYLLYVTTDLSRVGLFWAAFVLTRPLGATVGDFVDKPIAAGGLGISRVGASLVLALLLIGAVMLLPQKPERIAPRRP